MFSFITLCVLLCAMLVYICIRVGAKADTRQYNSLVEELYEMSYTDEMVKFKNEVESDLRSLDVKEKERY